MFRAFALSRSLIIGWSFTRSVGMPMFSRLFALINDQNRGGGQIGGGHLGVDNKMQSICICFVQSEFLSKLFHNLSLNFGGVQLQCCHGRL